MLSVEKNPILKPRVSQQSYLKPLSIYESSSMKFARSSKTNILHDKERLYEDKQKLKKQVNNLKDENLKLKTKIQSLSVEQEKYEELFDNQEQISKKKKFENIFIFKLKRKIK